MITIRKFTGTIMAAKIPNARIGLISDEALARKATAVVLEVTAIARNDLLKAYAILRLSSAAIAGINPAWRQASQKTKMSSAAIPRTIKIVNWFSVVFIEI